MPIEIESFKEKDAAEFCKVMHETISHYEKRHKEIDFDILRKHYTPEKIIELSKECKTWVAKKDGRIIGTIALQDNRIRNFVVLPKYHKQGIGKKLMETLKQEAKKQGLKGLWVASSPFGILAYEQLGFVKIRPIFNDEIKINEMLMELKF